MKLVISSLLLCLVPCLVSGLDNGLALTPPMGWLAWERFRCITDCETYPNECISENLFKRTADLMVSEGYAAKGYEYVIIDDCWLANERDEVGRLQADPIRFPSGIKALARYIHSLGLKIGIYEDYGNYTCAGYPGVLGHLEVDAQTFADWDIDYIKLDGCYSDPEDMDVGYPDFGRYLNQTGRPIVYACSWPFFQADAGIPSNFTAVKEFCNLWRYYYDIQDSWASVSDVIDHFAKKQDTIAQHAGPGHWNDPDMLVIGNFGLSYDQSKVQMAIWAVLAAPLLLSTELATVKDDYKVILQNEAIIAVNQDPMGIQGKRIRQEDSINTWTRPITPVTSRGETSWAVALVSRRDDGFPYLYKVKLSDIGLTNEQGYVFEELYGAADSMTLKPEDTLTVRVNPLGVAFFKATPVGAFYELRIL